MKKHKGYIGNRQWFVDLFKVLALLLLVLMVLILMKRCSDGLECERKCEIRKMVVRRTGYLPQREEWDSIPKVVPPYKVDSLVRLDSLDSLPHRVMLEQFFPPIGNQGNKGTCVAWATGYNLKTALNAIDNKWTKKQLEDPAYQTSPKDLWYGTRNHDSNCDGSNFQFACEALQQNGVATMKLVPYGNMSPCNGRSRGDAGNTISSYAFVQQPGVDVLKAYLRDTIPLLFAAKTGALFQSWRGEGVFSADIGATPGHAMVLVGYDDSLHAFRVRNSWGTGWGDEGSIWVDYDFFINDFYIHDGVFVLKNGQSHPSSVSQNNR